MIKRARFLILAPAFTMTSAFAPADEPDAMSSLNKRLSRCSSSFDLLGDKFGRRVPLMAGISLLDCKATRPGFGEEDSVLVPFGKSGRGSEVDHFGSAFHVDDNGFKSLL